MSMRIAVVQQDGNPGRPEEDLEKAIAFARQALDQNADVVLFHKELLLGYTPDLRDLAETADGPTTRALSRNDARLRKSWLLDRALDEQQGSRGHDEVVDLARRNSMIIASSCYCGLNESGDACSGGSNVTEADGSLLAELWNEEGVIVADVDPVRALDLRDTNPWYRGQRPDLYCREPATRARR